MNHLLFIVLESLRYDQCRLAKTPTLRKLGRIEKRYSYASWTSPSHYVYAMGVLPHRSPKILRGPSRANYDQDILKWKARLKLKNLKFKDFLPELSLPSMLSRHGYETHAFVSMPVLNPKTPLGTMFDDYVLMPKFNDFRGIVSRIRFDSEKPQFYFLNVGETHYPYAVPGESTEGLPMIHGVHGVFKTLDNRRSAGAHQKKPLFTAKQLRELKARQVRCVEYLDGELARLFARCPKNTWVIVTSDHGELFGENGYFGHGPIMHEKVFEVPFAEGRVPRI